MRRKMCITTGKVFCEVMKPWTHLPHIENVRNKEILAVLTAAVVRAIATAIPTRIWARLNKAITNRVVTNRLRNPVVKLRRL